MARPASVPSTHYQPQGPVCDCSVSEAMGTRPLPWLRPQGRSRGLLRSNAQRAGGPPGEAVGTAEEWPATAADSGGVKVRGVPSPAS